MAIITCLHDRDGSSSYLKGLAALYVSIRQHTRTPLHYYIVYDSSVDLEQLNRLIAFIKEDSEITPIPISNFPAYDALARKHNSLYSPAVIWRIFYPEILPNELEKVFSLDADLVPLCDISELYGIDIDGVEISAPLRRVDHPEAYLTAIRTKAENYFRMGACIFNLKQMRLNKDFSSNKLAFLEKVVPEINIITELSEQSLFNYFFSEVNKPLPCCLVPVQRNFLELGHGTPWDNEFARLKNVILDVKGWSNHSPFSLHYWAALMHTPWKEDSIRFFECIKGKP